MPLDVLHSQVDNIRAEAASTLASHSRQIDSVESDPHMNDEGKAAHKQQINEAAKASMTRLRQKENEAINMKVRDLEKVLDSKVGTTASDIIAFRDAQDRAERFDSHEDALKALERAIRTDDTVLAHAIFRRGIEANWRPVLAAFGNAYPDKQDLVGELAYLREAQTNTLARNMNYMWINR
jgi:hypothetical protein